MSFSATLRELQTLSGQQWLDRATRTLPQALTVVLVIAIAWQLVQLTWLLLERRAPADSGEIAIAPPPAAAARKGIDVQAIATAHLFGQVQIEQAAPEDAPPSQANLVLSAVFAANDPSKGLAVIGESPQSAKVYAVGAMVRPGTKVALTVWRKGVTKELTVTVAEMPEETASASTKRGAAPKEKGRDRKSVV